MILRLSPSVALQLLSNWTVVKDTHVDYKWFIIHWLLSIDN